MKTVNRSLFLAREALKRDHFMWVKYSRKHQKRGRDLYHWCHEGWKSNNFRGYGWGVSNALRKYVPNGDLTAWWNAGRSRGEVLCLFTLAIEETREKVCA